MKQVIFNVGGALSTYIQCYDKTIIIDLGKSKDFNPVYDFLLPLFSKRKSKIIREEGNKFYVDQLILSHPHLDHISSIIEFDEYFYPYLLTCPNSNIGLGGNEKLNWRNIEDNDYLKKYREMTETSKRQPPLKSLFPDRRQEIYWIPPVECENSELLCNESYCNNISLAVFFIINKHRIFLPGDLQKEGMIELLRRNYSLRERLASGLDVLVAPHHGLRSSFSVDLFACMKNNKTRCVNIVSEKITTEEGRQVDSRYSTKEFCEAQNNLGPIDEPHYQIKTSRGHIYIEYNLQDNPKLEIICDNSELLNKFL